MDRNPQSGPYTSGELASLSGVSADTIRHYEKLGLLARPVRTQGGYRMFPAEARLRVQTIRCALKAGFSLSELADIFKERDSGGAPCKRVAAIASKKVEALEAQIAELIDLHNWLLTICDEWKRALRRTPPGQPARLLESLAKQQKSTQKERHERKTNEDNHPHFSSLFNGRGPGANRRGMPNAATGPKYR